MKHLRALRKNAGLKVNVASEMLGIKKDTLYKIENGLRNPSIALLLKIREIYNCSFDDIFLPLSVTFSHKNDLTFQSTTNAT
jgi:putative transcriptional regulator